MRIGELSDSGLKKRRVGSLRRVTVAAPTYLGLRRILARPADLTTHECILRLNAGPERWVFRRSEQVEVHGRFRTDNATARNIAAAQGRGAASAPLWQVRSFLDRGILESVLADHEPTPIPVLLVWPATFGLPRRTRVLIDFVAGKLSFAGLLPLQSGRHCRFSHRLALEHVPIICTRNPHGGSNWRLGGRSVVERMSRWRGRGDEWFVRQAFAEMPSVC
jgi:LysR substrate binding domain-containing protein